VPTAFSELGLTFALDHYPDFGEVNWRGNKKNRDFESSRVFNASGV
jgi:hypothetical protein